MKEVYCLTITQSGVIYPSMESLLATSYNFLEREKHWQQFWEKEKTYKWDSAAQRKDSFVIDTPPYHFGTAPYVLADIDKENLNIDPDEIVKKISSKTKAIIVVHYGGNACEMDKLMEISKQYHVPIIEDVAHGLGADYRGKSLGTFGTLSAFSFYANKNITTFEGGMLCAGTAYIDKARIMSLHGINKNAWNRYHTKGNWYYDVVYPGLKYNMTDISASIGLVQLQKIENFWKKRKIIVSWYLSHLQGNAYLQLPKEHPSNKHAWYNFPIRLNLEKLKVDRDHMILALKNYMVATSVHFIPVHLHSYYKSKYALQPNDYPNAYREFKRIICLPIYPDITKDQVGYITDLLNYLCMKYAK